MKIGHTGTAASFKWSNMSTAKCNANKWWPPSGFSHSCTRGKTDGQYDVTNNSGLTRTQAPMIETRPTRHMASSSSSSSPMASSSSSSSPASTFSFLNCSLNSSLKTFSLANDFWISRTAMSPMILICSGCRQPCPALVTTSAMPCANGAMSSASSALARSAPTLSTNACTSSTTRVRASSPRVGMANLATCTNSAQHGHNDSRNSDARDLTCSLELRILPIASREGRM
mmetsp:Transcript_60148/g.160067  ORF Transcript_60148/g.160067 Transcript_60148/m.160067 type:complete len:229 (-) Transcript_60148:2111-2797(-)